MSPHLYLGFKLLHVLAVALFLGNITTGIFWKALPGIRRHVRETGLLPPEIFAAH